MNKYAVIVAGGKGLRMNTAIPKQFIPINGLPILMHTINKFKAADPDIQVILVLPETDITTWNELCEKYSFTAKVKLVNGGNTRFQSVRNGLSFIENVEGLVAIHDGVRPLVSEAIIANSFEIASTEGTAIASVPLKESIRKIDDKGGNKAVNRAQFCNIQTPQTFKVSLIKQAYSAEEQPTFTDDASVAEHNGHSIRLFEGSYSNIKVTTPEDLILASALLNWQ